MPHTSVRNFHARNPLMRKGGVHKKSKTAQRRAVKNNLTNLLDGYYEEQTNLTISEQKTSAISETILFDSKE